VGGAVLLYGGRSVRKFDRAVAERADRASTKKSIALIIVVASQQRSEIEAALSVNTKTPISPI